jgi:hypothetical protein
MSDGTIEVGQQWRNKKTGTTVVVETVIELSTNPAYPFQDIRYYTTTPNKKARRGACYSEYWHRNYERLKS